MDIFAAHAERQPDRPAIVEDERAVTWRAFVDARNRLAHALAGLPSNRANAWSSTPGTRWSTCWPARPRGRWAACRSR
jgi:hypothetical protein